MTAAARQVPARSILREARPEDNAALAALVRTVLPEFGGVGEGCAIMDPEVDRMYETYRQPRSAYFVVEENGKVVGGAGIAPLAGGDKDTCELQKTYLYPGARGAGLGTQLIARCLEAAKGFGYRCCYLETFSNMRAAQALYEKNGFTRIDGPVGNTGHTQCDHWYLKDL